MLLLLPQKSMADKPILLQDLVVTGPDGSTQKLSQFVGKPVILHFWATWCAPCVPEIREISAVATEYQGRITFVTISKDTDNDVATATEQVGRFIRRAHLGNLPVYFDPEDILLDLFDVPGLPSTYIFDKKGNLVGRNPGVVDWKKDSTIQTLESLL